ncbi:hypothetical protein M405DRAFT_868762 [Rhizopogon salebrosus TDB-379]|nr:hypothetical protein M405DRAFT_868762 [Rhizopogon salebrosus TDB-379]
MGAGILGCFSTPWFWHGGTQYRFMFAPAGQWWMPATPECSPTPARAYHPSAPPPKPQSTRPFDTRHSDPFYSHEQVSRLCACFITHLFACPEYPSSSSNPQVKLPHFITYALHRTKLHSSTNTFASLVLLRRLKARFPY